MIFLSHSWSDTDDRRSVHNIVSLINKKLKEDESTWFDEDKIIDDIDGSIVRGIEECSMFVSFLTKTYIKKICSAECNPKVRDNCYKEFSYAQLCKKPCIAVIMEKDLLDVSNWDSGIVKLYLGNKLYIDGTSFDTSYISKKILERHGKIISPRFFRIPTSKMDRPINLGFNIFGFIFKKRYRTKEVSI